MKGGSSDDRKAMIQNPQRRFGTSAISFTPLCQSISEETLKPVYVVSRSGGVKGPTHWVNVYPDVYCN